MRFRLRKTSSIGRHYHHGDNGVVFPVTEEDSTDSDSETNTGQMSDEMDKTNVVKVNFVQTSKKYWSL